MEKLYSYRVVLAILAILSLCTTTCWGSHGAVDLNNLKAYPDPDEAGKEPLPHDGYNPGDMAYIKEVALSQLGIELTPQQNEVIALLQYDDRAKLLHLSPLEQYYLFRQFSSEEHVNDFRRLTYSQKARYADKIIGRTVFSDPNLTTDNVVERAPPQILQDQDADFTAEMADDIKRMRNRVVDTSIAHSRRFHVTCKGGCPPPPPVDGNDCVPNPCAAHSNCIDLNFDYDCQCQPTWGPNYVSGSGCGEINNCSPNPCGANAWCKDNGQGNWGRNPEFKCYCNSGFQGDPYSGCTQINECSTQPCGPNTNCVDATGYRTCSCKSGFTMTSSNSVTGGQPITCQDINDCYNGGYQCAGNTDCSDCGANCKSCTCKAGFEGPSPATVSCTPIDECVTMPCGANTDCQDQHLGRICTCKSGYSPNPGGAVNGCFNTDDCSPNPCGALNDVPGGKANCVDGAPAIHTYTCSCPVGYTGNPNSLCTNIDDCFPNPCGANAHCIDGVASHTCVCDPLYIGDPNTGCTPECGNGVIQTGEVCDDNNPNSGDGCSSTCQVEPGWTCSGAPSTCSNIDECAPTNPCGANADCTDLFGTPGHLCNCQSGFEGNPYLGCTDIDDCSPNPCPANSVCADTGANSHSCTCLPGYAPDTLPLPTVCTDIDECASNPCGPNAACTTPFVNGFECDCNPSFAGDPYDTVNGCVSVHFCTGSPCGNNSFCTEGTFNWMNNPGPCFPPDPNLCTALCTCNPGFEGLAPGTPEPSPPVDCTPIDECALTGAQAPACGPNGAAPNTDCTDKHLGYDCSCKPGFEGNPMVGCTNIDDCLPFPCGENTICTDGVLSYTCSCKAGYEDQTNTLPAQNGAVNCTDIDDCAVTPCGAFTSCTDHVGSRTCTCLPGYDPNPTADAGCVDHDDCVPFPCGPNSACSDPVPGPNLFQCACITGHVGNPYDTTNGCYNYDDCFNPTNGSSCAGQTNCVDGINAFTCSCKSGFEGDPYNRLGTCTDIDECAPGPCAGNATCTHGFGTGTYSCACNNGFIPKPSAGVYCEEINECIPDPCGPNTICIDKIAQHQCLCKDGFLGDPSNTVTGCEDINECQTNPCHVDATCTNTFGSYTCECLPGYGGDGFDCSAVSGVLFLYSYLTTSEDGSTSKYIVRLTYAPAQDVTIKPNSTNTAEVVVDTPDLVFKPSNWGTFQTVVLKGVDDDMVDGSQEVDITHTIESSDINYQSLNGVLATVKVSNLDHGEYASVQFSNVDYLKVSESGSSTTFSLILTSEPYHTVTVTATNQMAGYLTPTVINTTFTPATWSVAQIVTYTGVDDGAVTDGDHTVQIEHEVHSDDLQYNGLPNSLIGVTVEDNDKPVISNPEIQFIFPAAQSGGPLTLDGIRFGTANSTIVITIGGKPCPFLYWNSNTSVVCDCPPGSGSEIPVSITVDGLANLAPYPNFFYVRDLTAPTCRLENQRVNNMTNTICDFGPGFDMPVDGYLYVALPTGFYANIKAADGPVPTASTLGVADGKFDLGPLSVQVQDNNRYLKVYREEPYTVVMRQGDTASVRLTNIRTPTVTGDAGLYALTTFKRDGRPHEGPTNGLDPLIIIDVPSEVLGSNFQKTTKESTELHWVPPATDNFSPVDMYEVEMDGKVILSLAVTNPDQATYSHKVSGLTPYTEYKFRLRCRNKAGWSDWTAELELLTQYDSPTITSLSPVVGPTTGGTILTLFGSNFGTSKGDISEVSVMDTTCLASATLQGEGVLTCVTPPSKSQTQLRTGDVQLVTNYGNSISPIKFTYYPQPEITGISVDNGPAGGGTKVVVEGAYFGFSQADLKNIKMAGVPCKIMVFLSSTMLECITDSTVGKKARTGKVSVDTVGGEFVAVWTYTYWNPDIDTVYPQGAPSSGGTTITLTGSHLGSSFSDVVSLDLAGESCLSTLWWQSESMIGCISPTASPKTGTVNITTTSGGNGPSKIKMFSFLSGDESALPPVVVSINPTKGPFTGGTEITVVGSWLGKTPADLVAVNFAGIPCDRNTLQWKNSSVIVCKTLPTTTSVSGIVNVETSAGVSKDVVPFEYVYPNPTLESIKPDIVPAAGKTVVTIRGVYFGRENHKQVTAYIGGVACVSSSWISSTEVHCLTPAYAQLAAQNGTDGLVTMTVQGRVNNPSTVKLKYAIGSVVNCNPECGWNAECVSGKCECHYGWSIPPDCAAPSVMVYPVEGTISERGKGVATFNIHLNEEPLEGEDVIVKAKSSDPTEAFLEPRSLTFTSVTWEANQTVTVTGLPDVIRDGNVTFHIIVKVAEGGPVFREGNNIPLLVAVNHETPPVILSVQPKALALEGGKLSVVAKYLDPTFTVYVNGTSYPHVLQSTPVTDAQIQTLATDEPAYLFNITLPELPLGYHRLEIVNEGGTRVHNDDLVYITDSCPTEGEWGENGNCNPCPPGAVCPGGGRIWAEEGYWIPDEASGIVIKCDPPSRCPGGRTSECAPGHEGFMCGACSRGWVQLNNKCKECPPKEQLFQTIMAAAIVWLSITAAAVLVTDRVTLSLAVFVLKSTQLLAGIGRLSNENVPDDLRNIFAALWAFSGDLSFHMPECLWKINYPTLYYAKLIYTTGILALFFIGMFASYHAQMWWHRMTTYEVDPDKVARIRSWHKNRTARCVLIWWTLAYLPMVFNWFDAISCFKQGDKHFMISRKDVQCYASPAYKAITAASVLLIIGWGAMMPLFFVYKLRRHSSELRSRSAINERWGILYELYRPGFSSFWLIDCFITAVVAGAASYLHPFPGAVWGATGFFLLLRMVVIVTKRPYTEMKLTFAQMAISLGYFIAITLIYQARQESLTAKSAEMMMTLIFILVGGPVGLTLLAVLYCIFVEKKLTHPCEDDYDEEKEDKKGLAAAIANLEVDQATNSSGVVGQDDIHMEMMTSSEHEGDGEDEYESDEEDDIAHALKRTMEIFSQDTWDRKGDILNGLIFGTAHASAAEDLALLEADLDSVDQLPAAVDAPAGDEPLDVTVDVDVYDQGTVDDGTVGDDGPQFHTVTDDQVDESTYAQS
eukprot:TRINITY_DN1525_c0_g1_i2.p1 TRINITY_DN1525_c0_g1~~TRINITY_DN1525_c0_g1_i2.p1  ORF type:complete len:3023 (-),score=588.09 TRINITY_DN1525_c0_g1_i2:123-9191(-)